MHIAELSNQAFVPIRSPMKFIFLLALGSLTAHASVQDICSLDQSKVQNVTNLNELEDNICDFRDSSNDREITRMSQQSLQILQRLQTAPPAVDAEGAPVDPLDNQELVNALTRVANLVTGKRSPATFSPQRNDALGSSMTQLFRDFGTEAQRNANKQGYYQSMRSVLAKTKEGARVLKCFERLEAGASKTVVNFAEPGVASPTATYEAQFVEASNSYHKIITISAEDSPSLTLALLAHEMQHSCNTAEFIRFDREQREYFTRIQTIAQTPGTPEEEITRMGMEYLARSTHANVRFALDELRAYQMTPKIFSELAPYHPEFFCNKFYVSSLFGRQILGTGDYMSSLETMVADGTFFYNLIDNYVKGAGYDPAAFYLMDESTGDIQRDSQGRPLFRPEVKAEMAKEGFRVP